MFKRLPLINLNFLIIILIFEPKHPDHSQIYDLTTVLRVVKSVRVVTLTLLTQQHRFEMSSTLFNKIYEIILKIPKGKVATYGQIAAMAGNPRAARVVGWVLNSLPNDADVPWHRVINSKGTSSLPLESQRKLQQALLEGEGVIFDKNSQVELEIFQWDGR